ncbi:LPS export ABC transporter ATP-binding protein [Candidatus Fermentibacteria bacterium]|nr:LPS export ABC transporter ATP-binding protein [Candidatus Fermentibacteria bacterium]
MLEAVALVKSYKRRRVVDHVDLQVEPGQIVGLLGPNGAGKTTTFYMMVGIVSADEGTVSADGILMSHLPVYRRARLGIGYLSQEPSVFRRLTVEENVIAVLEMLRFPPDNPTERGKTPARSRRLTRSAIRSRVDELLHELGLESLARQSAYTLSGGERRRVEIARALATGPRYLLLDEPFSGIDPIAVAELQGIVEHLRTKGLGVLITDHNVRETLAITNYAYIMYEGKIMRAGSSHELAEDPEARRLYLGDRFRL